MRIATSTAYDRGTSAILRENVDLNKTLLQIATGKRILAPSDDPADAARVLGLQQQKSTTEKYQDNVVATEINLGIVDSTLEGVVNSLQRIRELTVQGNNDSYDAVQRRTIAFEIEQVADGLLGAANQKNGQGEYLFAGYANDTQPFVSVANGEVEYVGSQDTKKIQIGPSRQIQTTDSGYNIFMDAEDTIGNDGSTKISLFKVVKDLEETLRTNDGPNSGPAPIAVPPAAMPETFHEAMARALNNIDASLKQILDVQATIGARQNATETQRNINADLLVEVESTMSEAQDLDYATAISRMELQQLGLQAAQQSFTKIQGLNLFNYI